MQTAKAIYRAPEGDAKECEIAGVKFTDGEPVELNSDEHPHLVKKLPGNPHFEVELGEDDGEPGPSTGKRDFKAGIDEARDHDFEGDRRKRQVRKPQPKAEAPVDEPATE